MGISHPLSGEFSCGGGGGMLLMSPERTPPSSPPAPGSCCSAVDGQDDFLEHEVSRMDTLACIAIKYGIEISDIKRANSLVSDSQMYAHKALLIPLPGRPVPSSLRSKRAWAPNHQQNRDIADPLDSSNSSQQWSSLAMSSLQSYYGLSSQRGDAMDQSTEMSLYSKGSSLDETLLNSSAPPESVQGINSNVATKEKQDGSIRRWQKLEADTQDDLLSDSIKMIRSFLPRPISSIHLNMDAKSSGSFFLDGFKSAVRKSPSAPSFADAGNNNNNGVSMWSSSKWAFNHDESFTRPLLDVLPKPAPVRRTKAALD